MDYRFHRLKDYFVITIILLVMFTPVTQNSQVNAADEFNYKIQPLMQIDPPTIPDKEEKELKVGAIMYPPDWITSFYVENDILLKPQDENGLSDFLQNWKGVVVSDHKLPDPPQKYAYQVRDIPKTSGWYRIRVDVDSADIDFNALADNTESQGYKGLHVFSSWKMLALFALILENKEDGNVDISMNVAGRPTQCPQTSSQEYAAWGPPHPADPNGGYSNAYTRPQFCDSELRVHHAWMLLDLFGRSDEFVNIAVIDQGFHMNQDFTSRSPYDFIDGDQDIDVNEEGYHGTKSSSMAAAALDNRYGSVGTGGQVAHLFPFRFDGASSQLAFAIRTAVYWSADVISISWGIRSSGGEHDDYEGLNEAIDEAFDNQVVVVVSAGNEDEDITTSGYYYVIPEGGSGSKHPIVVGAIDYTTKDAVVAGVNAGWGSNFGSVLDIWAPGGPESAIYTTPVPPNLGVTDISHFDGTSCACPYVAGVVAMMKAFNPGIRTDDVRTILSETANSSSHARVSQGFINAFNAVKRAAAGSIPSLDTYEPNDFTDFYSIENGTHCANLFSADTEDGYYFHVNDFIDATVKDSAFFDYNGYSATISGAGLTSRIPLPREGTLSPGAYYIRFERDPGETAFYTLTLDIDSVLAIAPDRFEDNNTLDSCRLLEFPEELIDDVWEIEDLNFHLVDDADYFELNLPDLPGDLYTDDLSIFVEPDERGTYHLAGFDVTTYDASDSPTFHGRGVTINGVHADFPDGHVRFSIEPVFQRNYYYVEIEYRQKLRGVTYPPEYELMEMPDWFEAMAAMHFLYVPPSALDGIPTPFSYPSDPVILDAISQGQEPDLIPIETMILRWISKANCGLNFLFEGNAQELDFWLIDAKGTVIAEDFLPGFGPFKRMADNNSSICKRIEYTQMERGFYGIQVQGTKGPIPFTLSIDSLITTSVKSNQFDEKPGHFALDQNYPNPFNFETKICFEIKTKSQVILKIYDVLGRCVCTLVDGYKSQGQYKVQWNGLDDQDRTVSSGIYIFRFQVVSLNETYTDYKKAILIK